MTYTTIKWSDVTYTISRARRTRFWFMFGETVDAFQARAAERMARRVDDLAASIFSAGTSKLL